MFAAETSRFSQHIPFAARHLARSSSCEISLGAVRYVSPRVHYHGRLPPRWVSTQVAVAVDWSCRCADATRLWHSSSSGAAVRFLIRSVMCKSLECIWTLAVARRDGWYFPLSSTRTFCPSYPGMHIYPALACDLNLLRIISFTLNLYLKGTAVI